MLPARLHLQRGQPWTSMQSRQPQHTHLLTCLLQLWQVSTVRHGLASPTALQRMLCVSCLGCRGLSHPAIVSAMQGNELTCKAMS